MKLLDIMKKYDRCVVRESARLTKIYNMILKESESKEEALDEEVCPDCGNDPCTCESEAGLDKDDTEVVSAAEFFGEKEDNVEECGTIPESDFIKDESEEVEECDLIPEEDFIKDESEEVEENDMLRNRPHNGHIDDPRGIVSEKECEGEECKKKECKGKECNEDDTEVVSAAEFFGEKEDETPEPKDTDEAEQMMSAAEFFAEDGDADLSEETEVTPDEGLDEDADASEMLSAKEFFGESEKEDESEKEEKKEKKEEEPKKKEEDDEKDDEDDEKVLEESLKSYRRKNHHLFNG